MRQLHRCMVSPKHNYTQNSRKRDFSKILVRLSGAPVDTTMCSITTNLSSICSSRTAAKRLKCCTLGQIFSIVASPLLDHLQPFVGAGNIVIFADANVDNGEWFTYPFLIKVTRVSRGDFVLVQMQNRKICVQQVHPDIFFNHRL